LNKVVKTTVFIKDMDSFAKVNEVYAKYFSEPYPARSCVEVSKLPKGVLIEIEAVAINNKKYKERMMKVGNVSNYSISTKWYMVQSVMTRIPGGKFPHISKCYFQTSGALSDNGL